MQEIQHIFDMVLHEGIYTYKRIGSAAALPQLIKTTKRDEDHKKGSLFVTRVKEDLSTSHGVKGYIISSKETLLEDYQRVSHWTPNVFNYGTYTNQRRTYIKGHVETNLQQINTFVVDIDSKKQPYTEILTAALDQSIGVPTLILETPKGFQVYFVLDKPLFISSKNEFRGLKVAKRISENIKGSLSKVLTGVDLSCNDFGFFRIPKEENIRWFSKEMTFDFGHLIEWSRRQDDNYGRGLFVVHDHKAIHDVTQEEWFQELLAAKQVKGQQGQIGRDNLLFTLALACYSAGKEESETYNVLDQVNSSLHAPLKHAEVKKILKSAYKGRFKGAHSSYIQQLLEEWGSGKAVSIQTRSNGWHKFKKARIDRKRSHYEEWETDILAYISQQTSISDPIKWTTQKQICEAIGIARSTFTEVVKKSTKIMMKTEGKGCQARTGLTSVAVLLQCALAFNQAHRAIYTAALQLMFKERDNTAAITSCENIVQSVRKSGRTRVPDLFGLNSS
ncbi:primase C-terminal domain-containing protein [Paenisporosarcina antarctica]|uniref:Replication initiation protein n=1 Tax=Paenisporosarcina antarctica TaxID=417367 RepID=A0A4P7A4X7_9BACL|nr:primase C-terminal domain-containing protein [Paenisporosarcina antarctica]QBP43206.1 replication initiation protein [Paenisporosarcina antarctica]